MKITKELIERYHQGQCSPEEQDIVEQWLDSDEVEMSFPENADLNAMEDKGWKKISSRYHIPEPLEPRKVVKLYNYRIILQFAACIMLVLSTFFYVNTKLKNENHNPTLAYKEVKTLKGQKLSVSLPDGTIVWMNAESILRFPVSFKGHLRELEFSGEAYFNVAKDRSKPFVIHTAKTKVQVLGTRFNLRALVAETATSVVVEEGKVQFSGNSGKQQQILTANNRGVFGTDASGAFSMKTELVHAGKYTAWKNNELLFDNLTMDEVAQVLERWYNVKITINRPELRKERYTGSFNNPALSQVLESMGFAVKFNYKQHGQGFVLY
ncbi:FecR family protein [Pedobacter sp. ok626]|uniref:FecR family protein n=1 Tax=Pedobacter sp. ok626 TaxID=1761882 RepID=UPI0008832413|nr:FecR domain-containing protein [Pedobacter sp. ok626]SDL35773.1 FecR family protein [Pedobacter sp. ok626]